MLEEARGIRRLFRTLSPTAICAGWLVAGAHAQEHSLPWTRTGEYGADRDVSYFAQREWRDLKSEERVTLRLRLGERTITQTEVQVQEFGGQVITLQFPAALERLLPAMSLELEAGEEHWTIARQGVLERPRSLPSSEEGSITLGVLLDVQPYDWGTRRRAAVQLIAPILQGGTLGLTNGQYTRLGQQGNILAPGAGFTPPAVSTFHPTNANEGDAVAVSGSFQSVLNGFDPEDVLVISEGLGGYHGSVTGIQSDTLDFVLDEVSAYAEDAPFEIEYGFGDTQTPPVTGVVPPEVWALRAPLSLGHSTSNQELAVNGGSIFGTCQPVPSPARRVHGQLFSDKLHFQLPASGVCAGDRFAMWFRVQVGQEMQTVRINYFDFDTSLSWDTVAPFILVNMLNFTFLFHTDGALPLRASYDVPTNSLVIEGWDPATSTTLPLQGFEPESAIGLTWPASQNISVSQTQGVPDNYVTSNSEPLTPTAALVAAVQAANPSLSPAVSYDSVNTDQIAAESFDDFGSQYGEVRAAHLTVRFKGTPGANPIDVLTLGWSSNGAFQPWSIAMDEMPGIGTEWNIGEDVEVCFDLSRLVKNGEITDLVEALNDGTGEFHLYMVDDSTFDYLELKVWRCLD